MIYLAYSLIIILGLLTGLLAWPLSFRAQGRWRGTGDGSADIRALGGLVRLEVAKASGSPAQTQMVLGGWAPAVKGTRSRPAAKKIKTADYRWQSWLDIEIMTAIFNCLKRLFGSFKLQLWLEGEYGTGDPAATGMLAGLLGTLAQERPGIVLTPNFMEATLDIAGEFQGRVYPLVVLFHLARLLLSAPVRRLWCPIHGAIENKEGWKQLKRTL